MSFEYLYNLQVQEFVQQLYATNLLVSQNPAQLYRSHVQLPLPQQPGSSQETAPAPAPPPAPAALEPVEEEANEEPIFRGEKNSSKNGVYPVLVYDIPGSERCYVFQHHKKTARGDSLIYRCSGCRHQNQKFTSVLVTDDIFHKDPCRLNHNCIPLNRYKDKAERVIYESCQEIKQDEKAHRTPTQRHYSAAAKKILNMPWRTEEERQKVLEKFSRNSYEDKRRSFARASSAHRRKVEMENVPEDLRKLPWGEDFLQAAIRAAKEAFPNAEVHGCGFHLAQAWNRKAAEYGLR
ncbi:hypothetical protein ANCCAN_16351 [Ancylostoma caninum]|uniref:MULE transposase domain-containing protein n=1 Tax=Ancylostoma caninum TaxID=29170 RepID=A0A368G053_ANCCA|nr:hypothetical protein ANCCAN_16351 [Ancylostoma caninum]